jgi:hypothetical protein
MNKNQTKDLLNEALNDQKAKEKEPLNKSPGFHLF